MKTQHVVQGVPQVPKVPEVLAPEVRKVLAPLALAVRRADSAGSALHRAPLRAAP